jgi:hypothetical protein
VSAEDDRAVMERLAALEAEVKADADSQRARKDAALERVREQRAQQQAERDALRARQAELVSRRKGPARSAGDGADDDDGDGLEDLSRAARRRGRGRGADGVGDADGIGDALALAKRAHGVKQELARRPETGEKSWIKSGLASMLLGPLGWLYAGSLREAVPASAAWLLIMGLVSKFVPLVLLMPVLLVVLPLSGIAGVVYALQYNRAGSRQRLFDKDKDGDQPKKRLRGGDAGD